MSDQQKPTWTAEEIDDLYEKVKSHTRSCECENCYTYEAALRDQR